MLCALLHSNTKTTVVTCYSSIEMSGQVASSLFDACSAQLAFFHRNHVNRVHLFKTFAGGVNKQISAAQNAHGMRENIVKLSVGEDLKLSFRDGNAVLAWISSRPDDMNVEQQTVIIEAVHMSGQSGHRISSIDSAEFAYIFESDAIRDVTGHLSESVKFFQSAPIAFRDIHGQNDPDITLSPARVATVFKVQIVKDLPCYIHGVVFHDTKPSHAPHSNRFVQSTLFWREDVTKIASATTDEQKYRDESIAQHLSNFMLVFRTLSDLQWSKKPDRPLPGDLLDEPVLSRWLKGTMQLDVLEDEGKESVGSPSWTNKTCALPTGERVVVQMNNELMIWDKNGRVRSRATSPVQDAGVYLGIISESLLIVVMKLNPNGTFEHLASNDIRTITSFKLGVVCAPRQVNLVAASAQPGHKNYFANLINGVDHPALFFECMGTLLSVSRVIPFNCTVVAARVRAMGERQVQILPGDSGVDGWVVPLSRTQRMNIVDGVDYKMAIVINIGGNAPLYCDATIQAGMQLYNANSLLMLLLSRKTFDNTYFPLVSGTRKRRVNQADALFVGNAAGTSRFLQLDQLPVAEDANSHVCIGSDPLSGVRFSVYDCDSENAVDNIREFALI